MLTDSRLGRGEPGLLPFYVVVIKRAMMEPLLRRWSEHKNFCFRTTAIIAQLPGKSATDVDLLGDVIRANLGESEFFIRKAIGWALRQHATTDPDWVRAFVADHPAQLSPLSRREALKHL